MSPLVRALPSISVVSVGVLAVALLLGLGLQSSDRLRPGDAAATAKAALLATRSGNAFPTTSDVHGQASAQLAKLVSPAPEMALSSPVEQAGLTLLHLEVHPDGSASHAAFAYSNPSALPGGRGTWRCLYLSASSDGTVHHAVVVPASPTCPLGSSPVLPTLS